MVRLLKPLFLGFFALSLIGCGGGGGSNNPGSSAAPQPDFAIGALSSVTVTPNSTQSISISVNGINGFSSPVNFTLSGLPAGVSASPTTFTLTPAASSSSDITTRDIGSSSSQIVQITAGSSATAGQVNMTVTATSGSITHSAMTPTGGTDFALTVPQPTLSLTVGSSSTLSISADAFNSFAGQVNVSFSGLPQGVTVSPSSITVTPGASQTVTLAAAQGAQPGTATISLQGTSGSLAHNLELSLAVTAAPPPPDFSLSITPAALTLQAGGSAQAFSVSATALNGLTGTIDVTLSGLPSGVAAAPAVLTLTPGTPQQVSLNAASTTPGGTSAVTVEATWGAITHSAQLSLTVQPAAPDFSLSINPASVTVSIAGAAQQVSVTANAVGAFTSPVNVTLAGLPAGVTATPSSLTLTPGSAQTISLQAGSSAVAGETSVSLQGTSGALSHSAALSLTVAAPSPDFQLFAGPSTLNLSTIAVQPMTIALIPLNGFNAPATVTITGLPAGVTVLNPPLPLIANIPQTIQLDPAGGGATAGQSTITVTATAGTITHSAQVNLVISTPSSDYLPYVFAGSNPGAVTIIPGLLLTPGTYTFSIQESVAGGQNSGSTVQLSGLVPGTGLNQTQYTFSESANQAVFNITTATSAVGERGVLKAVFTGSQINHEIDLPIYVVAQPTVISYIAPITVQQGAAADLLYEVASTSQDSLQVYLGQGWPQDFWLNPYLADSNPVLVGTGFGASEVGQYSVSTAANAATGTSNLPIEFASDDISQTVSVQTQVVPASDFSVAAEPGTIALNPGATQTFTVSASAVDGFSSPVSVSLDNVPVGVQVSPQTFTLQPGDSQTVTLTTGTGYSSGSGGALSVDATSGSLAHSARVAVSPGSFTGDLTVTGNTFSIVGLATIYTSGIYYATAANGGNATGIVPYVPYQGEISNAVSNCGGNTTSVCTPVNLLLLTNETSSPPLALPVNQNGSLVLQADFGGGTQYAVFPYDQALPDFVLNFSPASLSIPAGASATLSVTYTAVSPTLTQYCTTPFSTLEPGNIATISAPPPLGPISSSDSTVNLCEPYAVTISVPASVPPGNYELTVAGQINAADQPYQDPATAGSDVAYDNPDVQFSVAHTYGVPVTVTAAPTPSFQIAASPGDINVASGQSFPVTVSATGSNGFTGASVTASNLPAGVTISPASFTVDAGSSQSISISAAAGTASESGQITLTGTSGSLTSSTQISISVTSP